MCTLKHALVLELNKIAALPLSYPAIRFGGRGRIRTGAYNENTSLFRHTVYCWD